VLALGSLPHAGRATDELEVIAADEGDSATTSAMAAKVSMHRAIIAIECFTFTNKPFILLSPFLKCE
jgi:hypothetical protein